MSECDNEELIATRRLNGLDDNLYKSADEMFEELNYIEHFKITMQELQAINKKCKELGWI